MKLLLDITHPINAAGVTFAETGLVLQVVSLAAGQAAAAAALATAGCTAGWQLTRYMLLRSVYAASLSSNAVAATVTSLGPACFLTNLQSVNGLSRPSSPPGGMHHVTYEHVIGSQNFQRAMYLRVASKSCHAWHADT
jgi:hypothetical protein